MEQHEVRTTANGAVDEDPTETREWLDALESVARVGGSERALFLLRQLEEQAQQLGHHRPRAALLGLPEHDPARAAGRRIRATSPWRSGSPRSCAGTRSRWWCAPTQAYGELGGHIASYASAAELFEVGFNHFFRGADETRTGGDLVFFQPHSAPGVYARAFLEGRLTEEQLAHYRQEVGGRRPVLLSASVADAGLLAVPDRLDGHRADQRDLPGALHALPRSTAASPTRPSGTSGACSATARWTSPNRSRALTLAAREGLDNLTFVINCNLQRLDGPVRGNGQIIQELEALFAGAGWNVIKVLWGSDWDALFARDTRARAAAPASRRPSTASTRRSAPTTARYNREHFFGADPELHALVAHMTRRRSTRSSAAATTSARSTPPSQPRERTAASRR